MCAWSKRAARRPAPRRSPGASMTRSTGGFSAPRPPIRCCSLISSRPGRPMRRSTSPSRSAPRAPGVADVTRIVARLARRGVERALHIEQWFLAYRFGGRVQAGLEGFTRIMPPKDRDWADPFVVEKSGRYYIFFEELIYAEGKAHIAMLELDRAGRTSTPSRVLEADYHLSYPYIFEHDGQLWMLPESSRSRRVELYRCVDFPLSWKRECVLLEDVRLVDATLHVEKGDRGRWWMFANSAA